MSLTRCTVKLVVRYEVCVSCPGTGCPTYGKRATPPAARRLRGRLEPAAGRSLATDGRATMPASFTCHEQHTSDDVTYRYIYSTLLSSCLRILTSSSHI